MEHNIDLTDRIQYYPIDESLNCNDNKTNFTITRKYIEGFQLGTGNRQFASQYESLIKLEFHEAFNVELCVVVNGADNKIALTMIIIIVNISHKKTNDD